MQVSKLESSRRQLETVISMYFAEGDPVSMHALTAAAYNVLRNINTKIGGNPMLIKDQLVNIAPSEKMPTMAISLPSKFRGLIKTFSVVRAEMPFPISHPNRAMQAAKMAVYLNRVVFIMFD
jgi:hypothetical protein